MNVFSDPADTKAGRDSRNAQRCNRKPATWTGQLALKRTGENTRETTQAERLARKRKWLAWAYLLTDRLSLTPSTNTHVHVSQCNITLHLGLSNCRTKFKRDKPSKRPGLIPVVAPLLGAHRPQVTIADQHAPLFVP